MYLTKVSVSRQLTRGDQRQSSWLQLCRWVINTDNHLYEAHPLLHKPNILTQALVDRLIEPSHPAHPQQRTHRQVLRLSWAGLWQRTQQGCQMNLRPYG